jgi:hypothetical protein
MINSARDRRDSVLWWRGTGGQEVQIGDVDDQHFGWCAVQNVADVLVNQIGGGHVELAGEDDTDRPVIVPAIGDVHA